MHEHVLQHPLLCYAARYWAAHANECSAQSVMDLSLHFLRDDYKVSSAAQVLFVRIANKYAAEGFLGCGLDSQYGDPVSGIHLAVYFGFDDMISTLLDNGFEADVRDVAFRSPLFWAAQMGHARIVDSLLSLNEHHGDRKRRRGRSGAMLKVLPTTNVVDVNCRDIDGNTPSTVAASHSHVDVVVQLLGQAEILPNLAPKNGLTALICAAQRGDESMVKLLIGCTKVDVNLEPPDGRTALIWAIKRGRQDLVSIVLSHREIDVNLQSKSGDTPLIAATAKNDESIVKLLLAHPKLGVTYNSRACTSALAVATVCGYKPIEKLLLATSRESFGSLLYQAGYECSLKEDNWYRRRCRLSCTLTDDAF